MCTGANCVFLMSAFPYRVVLKTEKFLALEVILQLFFVSIIKKSVLWSMILVSKKWKEFLYLFLLVCFNINAKDLIFFAGDLKN